MNRRRNGFALVAVLWGMSLLAVVAVSLTAMVRGEALLMRNRTEQAQAEALAEAGISLAVMGLLEPRPDRRWAADGVVRTVVFAGRRLRVAIEDEQGKIDLNSASPELLAGLFVSAGQSKAWAAVLADRVADWRDEDDLRRLNGAESADYQNAGHAARPRNGPFQSLEELGLVLEVSPDLPRRVRPALTLYSGRGAPDPTIAPRDILAALPEMTEAKIDKIVEARRRHDRQEGVVGLTEASSAGNAYTIIVEVPWGDERSSFVRQAVIRLTGSPRFPYWIQGWGTSSKAPGN